LNCRHCNLTELDLSANIFLEHLNCFDNNLTELDLSANIFLEHLDCGMNYLYELDVSNNIYLKFFDCYSNNLNSLDITKNIFLENLCFISNNLNEIDISKNINLRGLLCDRNNLTELDVSNNPALGFLWCRFNKFKFSTLPIINVSNSDLYQYSPQDTIYGGVMEYTEIADLSDEYEISGHITNFQWFDITDGIEKTIWQPTNANGAFTFTESHIDKKLRCKMRNAQFPDLTLVYETDIIVGITEPNIATHFTVLSNPIFSEVVLNLGLLESGIYTIEMFDLLGNAIHTIANFYDIGEHIVPVETNNISNGIYFFRLLTEGMQVGVANFMVVK